MVVAPLGSEGPWLGGQPPPTQPSGAVPAQIDSTEGHGCCLGTPWRVPTSTPAHPGSPFPTSPSTKPCSSTVARLGRLPPASSSSSSCPGHLASRLEHPLAWLRRSQGARGTGGGRQCWCRRRWSWRWMRWEKRPWHWWHWKGFSPECSRRWVFRLLLLLKLLWHVCGGERMGGSGWVLHPGLGPSPPPSRHPSGTYRALVGLLAGVDQAMLLQMCQLCEALLADGAMEGPLAAVHPQVDLRGDGGHRAMGGGTQGTQEFRLPRPPHLLGASRTPRGTAGAQGPKSTAHLQALHALRALCWGETEAWGALPAQLGRATTTPCPLRVQEGCAPGWGRGASRVP